MSRILVLASGGLDSSTTMLKLAIDGDEVYPLFIDYGQKSVLSEKASVTAVVHSLQARDLSIRDPIFFDLTSLGSFHNKVISSGRITFFPFRNLILASIGAEGESESEQAFIFFL
jgi:7-cyano-7-deazaguanine synthase in queuosine biosynthesis